MSGGVIAVVLLSALMHATWNAMLKRSGDGAVTIGLIALGHAVPGGILVLLLPLPDPRAWPFIAASTVIHWAYYYLLNIGYRTGDFSVVYPIARGLSPVMVALASLLLLDEVLTPLAWGGILAISAGMVLLARPGRLGGVAPAALWAAMGVAVSIAAYSMADGVGARVSGQILSYVAWLYLAEILVAGWVLSTRRDRLRAMPVRAVALGFAGGLISASAYGLVLWAKTQAPLGLVSAMRETSVVFAALIGVFLFAEGPRAQRILAALVVFAGVALIAWG